MPSGGGENASSLVFFVGGFFGFFGLFVLFCFVFWGGKPFLALPPDSFPCSELDHTPSLRPTSQGEQDEEGLLGQVGFLLSQAGEGYTPEKM